jgi:hypothetical protein
MALQAYEIGKAVNSGSDFLDAAGSLRGDGIAPRRKISGLFQTDDEATRFQVDLDFAGLDLLVELGGEVIEGRQQFGVPRWSGGVLRLGSAGSPHLGVAFASFIDRAAQDFVDCGLHSTLFEGLLDGIGNHLSLGLVGLRRGEHHHEEGKQKGNEIGVGNQPAFVIFVRGGLLFAGHAQLPAATAWRAGLASAAALVFFSDFFLSGWTM